MKTLERIALQDIKYTTVRNNKGITYLNLECGFDIETTSTQINGAKVGYMYVYTFGIKNRECVWLGRTWEEFINDCKHIQKTFDLSSSKRLVCYVQNLQFEFQFMQHYLGWEEVFAIEDRKVLRALSEYGIEFRDAYLLSGGSLADVANNLNNRKIEKLTGNLDYNKRRNYKTPLTQEEIDYCINDVDILLYYVGEQLEIYGDMNRIPLTNTGRVRKFVRDNCFYTNKNHKKSNKSKYKKYRNLMANLTLDEDSYNILKQGFMGGYVHANAEKIGRKIPNVKSYDLVSSYPAVMLSEKFPMSKPIKTIVKSKEEFEDYIRNFAYIFEVEFSGLITTKGKDNYISESKCLMVEKPIINNGRVFSAEKLKMVITEVDFEIIKQNYSWTGMKVGVGYRFYKGYLPKEIIKSIIDLYRSKTELKGICGREIEYKNSKSMLNSIFGMCVTDIVRPEHKWENNKWVKISAEKSEQIEKYNNSANRFLYYPWGVWITAYARKNLWTGILALGDSYVYSDTDSLKIENAEKCAPYFEWYNKRIIKKLKLMCAARQIDFTLLQPKNLQGEIKTIGVWEEDGDYTNFKTLGAKRYFVEQSNNYFITVSGLAKLSGVEYLKSFAAERNKDVFDVFTNLLKIPAEKTGKLAHTYIDSALKFTDVDYLGNSAEISVKSGVYLEPVEYNLSITDKYASFIANFMQGYVFAREEI